MDPFSLQLMNVYPINQLLILGSFHAEKRRSIEEKNRPNLQTLSHNGPIFAPAYERVPNQPIIDPRIISRRKRRSIEEKNRPNLQKFAIMDPNMILGSFVNREKNRPNLP
ncbi:hypothetical protein CEXT_576441 [Caerostris extrusa]|uniref:Uncharacterized protein n=1 Tax=Caerostris extrusa TaxID=172846 RepID=A0AAV4UWA7_CAEEX|nr:hypothetical protein CEXT_576441 [Caerostris extrusa]